MARYKHIHKDENHELLKRRYIIRRLIGAVLVIFWIALICIGGVFQHNDTVVGWSVIAIGVVNTAYTAFEITVHRRGWKLPTTYDSESLYREKYLFPKAMIEEESKKLETELWITIILVAIFGICCFVFGIAKLI